MKPKNNQPEHALWMCLGVLALLTLGVWLLGGCESQAPGKIMSAADCIRAQNQHEAEIWAEAHAPGPSREDQQRIADVMSAHAAQERHELAEYAKFQFDQRLELAEASAPRITIGADGTMLGSANSERHGQAIALGGRRHDNGQEAASDSVNASDQLYVRKVLENSANKLSADAAQRDQEAAANTNSEQGAPYGNPVAGRPGFVTSPSTAPTGYIDVRGYSPGTPVIDPYTGQAIRVP